MSSTTKIPAFHAASDTGKFAKAMVLKKDEVLGKNALSATDDNLEQVVQTFKEAKGEELVYEQTDKETYMGNVMKSGAPDYLALELYEDVKFMDELGY